MCIDAEAWMEQCMGEVMNGGWKDEWMDEQERRSEAGASEGIAGIKCGTFMKRKADKL